MPQLSSEPSGTRLMLVTFGGVQSSGESESERAGMKRVLMVIFLPWCSLWGGGGGFAVWCFGRCACMVSFGARWGRAGWLLNFIRPYDLLVFPGLSPVFSNDILFSGAKGWMEFSFANTYCHDLPGSPTSLLTFLHVSSFFLRPVSVPVNLLPYSSGCLQTAMITLWFHWSCLCYLVCAALVISHWERFSGRASCPPDVVDLLRLRLFHHFSFNFVASAVAE